MVLVKTLKKPNARMFILLVLLSIIFVYFYNNDMHKEQSLMRNLDSKPLYKNSMETSRELKEHKQIIEKYYEKRKNWETSHLGSILFKNVLPNTYLDKERQKRQYLILIWKHWNWLSQRHVNNYHRSTRSPREVLDYCSVKNCIFSGHDEDFQEADAVVIHLQKGVIPNVTTRNPKQRWIYLSDESPHNTFSLSRFVMTLTKLSGMFNWTMTYRSDSDVPVPYGRTIPLVQPLLVNLDDPVAAVRQLVPFWDKKQFTVLAAVLISNCAVKSRMKLISILGSYIDIEVHGRCAENKTSCPGHFRADCEVLNRYIFYLALENSKCRQYLTEKVFNNAYHKGAIPIIMGAPLEDCQKLLPPNSFLHVDNYNSPEELALHMLEIAGNYENLLKYHKWRKHFSVVGEHGFFKTKSYHLCRICEALNYNDNKEKVYRQDDLELYFDKKVLCDSKYAREDPFG
ncbi:alpha-(1,3)-fucosyltransferase 7-like [Pectinophora gossypiella]|uniref:alpha-(1,3)-fucosyltransferase 7-like n=1 Tax=Pectinophora gossypiella TaxID=13191 RepID=UPI00214EC94C|nr:alpha-(1,3)-fucosyltransferase 7-like [Pectinophora gossypiella]